LAKLSVYAVVQSLKQFWRYFVSFRMTIAIAAYALFANAALAQSSDPAWVDELNLQIQIEKQCEVVLVLNMSERQIGGETAYEARVRCGDGRMFDASRIGELAPFQFKACEIQVC
jgi:hypothetical protein